MGTKPIAISIRDVCFRYPNSAFSLEVQELDIHKGERVAITGKSGCGKTTFTRLISGLSTPSEGSVTVDGRELSLLSDRDRRNFRVQCVGSIAQELDLLEHLRVGENLLLPFLINPALKESATLATDSRNLAERLGIGDKWRRFPHQLSQGERQRVAIGRALITRPQILIADEPTGNLDGGTARQVLDLIAELLEEEKTTFVMVTHDLSLLDYFDRQINLPV